MEYKKKYTHLFSFFLLLFFSLLGNQSWASSKGTIIKTAVEYTTPAIGYTLDEPYTPVMHYNGSMIFPQFNGHHC